MDSHIRLYKGYFWSAGKQYGWAVEDPGVGIKYSDIRRALPYGRVFVDSKYDELSIMAKIALSEVKNYNSFMTIGGVKLAIIRKSRFVIKKKKDWRSEKRDEKTKAMKDQGQGELFNEDL